MTDLAFNSVAAIQNKIHLIRDVRVMLDSDLAELYQVETGALNRAVKRNLDRFPEDFMFQLSKGELDNLKSQFGISSSWGGRRYPPYAFTEQGVAMLSSVLSSTRAIQVNITIMRTFVSLRQLASQNMELSIKLSEIEKRLGEHDGKIRAVIQVIRGLTNPKPLPKRRKIGFIIEE